VSYEVFEAANKASLTRLRTSLLVKSGSSSRLTTPHRENLNSAFVLQAARTDSSPVGLPHFQAFSQSMGGIRRFLRSMLRIFFINFSVVYRPA